MPDELKPEWQRPPDQDGICIQACDWVDHPDNDKYREQLVICRSCGSKGVKP